MKLANSGNWRQAIALHHPLIDAQKVQSVKSAYKLALGVDIGLELHHGIFLALPVLVDLVGEKGQVGLLHLLLFVGVGAHPEVPVACRLHSSSFKIRMKFLWRRNAEADKEAIKLFFRSAAINRKLSLFL